MGLVRKNIELEDYFDQSKIQWNILTDKEYRELVKQWIEIFEEDLALRRTSLGSRAIDRLEDKLPVSGYVFNCPNYKYLVTTTGGKGKAFTFAYKVTGISKIDRAKFNSFGIILCDMNFRFMCAFNQEAPELIPEIYSEE